MGCEQAVLRSLVPDSSCTAAISLNVLEPTCVPASSMAKYIYLQQNHDGLLAEFSIEPLPAQYRLTKPMDA